MMSERLPVGQRIARVTPAGEVLETGEVIEHVEGYHQLHGYRIRWDDGTVSLFSPSGRGLRPLTDSERAA